MTSAVLHASLMPFLTEDQCKVVVAAYVLFNTLCGLHLSRFFLRFFPVFANFCAKNPDPDLLAVSWISPSGCSQGGRYVGEGQETPTQWKSESVTDLLTN